MPDIPADPAAAVAALIALMQARQTILPKRLTEPGPSAAELDQIVSAAAHAPDHGQLLPWRLLRIPAAQRPALAEVFATALLERNAAATPLQVAQARDKAYRSPELLLLLVDGACGSAEIDLSERLISAGCAVQNMLLLATALGYGSGLTSGKALKSAGLRALFGLSEGQHAVCFISLGTIESRKKPRQRPVLADYFSTLGEP